MQGTRQFARIVSRRGATRTNLKSATFIALQRGVTRSRCFQTRGGLAMSNTRGAITAIPLEDRLHREAYDAAECSAAIEGKKLPENLGSEVTRLCTIRGIRYHPEFGKELYVLKDPEFTRALNARAIMSNQVPVMTEPDQIPYCIWYPETATVETYRELAKLYPQLRYNVGRACAVAGYFDLFKELQLLPEVSIAEEARESGETGHLIYEDIMKQPIRYAIMDDYTRSVNLESPRVGAYLNGDTAVRSLLEIKKQHCEAESSIGFIRDPFREYCFNITEDCGIDTYDSEHVELHDIVPLLYNPLPNDIPTVYKDLLIIMAAYNGDVDRYARLRRPEVFGIMEHLSNIRGIYHDTMFAKWCSLQPELERLSHVAAAITARFIMNNDLSRVTENTSVHDLPYQIWWPNWAHSSTYEELARRQPALKEQAGRACIVADYEESYRRILPEPHYYLAQEAKSSCNKFYIEDLRRRGTELGVDIDRYPWEQDNSVRESKSRDVHPEHRPETFARYSVTMETINDSTNGWYDGRGVNFGQLNLLACLPGDLKPTYDYPALDVGHMYWQSCRPGEQRGMEYPGGRWPRSPVSRSM